MFNDNFIPKSNNGPTNILDQMIGKSYFFRTITYHYVGKVVGIFNEDFLVLENASWVADSGRFGEAIKNGTLQEIEYVENACVNLKSLTDFLPWNHPLPAASK